MVSHNPCTLHTCVQLMKSPFSHAAPLLILKRSRCLRLFILRSHRVQGRVRGSCQLASRAVWSTTRLSESNTSAVELRSDLSCPQMLLLQRERDKFPTSMQVLTCCSSGQVMWDVDATCWKADQVSFQVPRVLHVPQAPESRNNVQPPSLPTVVIDHCIPRFCCYP